MITLKQNTIQILNTFNKGQGSTNNINVKLLASGLTVDYLEGGYTFNFQNVGGLNLSSNYTKVKASSIQKIAVEGNYLTLKLGEIGNAINISSNYSDIQLGANKNTNAISIDGNYTHSKIKCTPDYAFDVKVELKYGSLIK